MKQVEFKPSKIAQIAKEMNEFVETTTKGEIKKLMSADDLKRFTAAVIINAIYSKMKFETQFDPS